ncbi:MAG: DNA/RNA nuclease SfsA [Candidatus Bathyarchaeota archaeon]|nr:DNA/RNA nuclease SfsA [Candidatus Termiticorpusculum sp.]
MYRGCNFYQIGNNTGYSRFDFYVEAGTRRIFIEAKDAALKDGVVLFPDTPTEWGVNILRDRRCIVEKHEVMIIFVIQMNNDVILHLI